MNRKILFYLPFIKLGGIERVSIEYLNGLISKGYKVDLIIDFDMGKDGNTFEYAIPKGVNFQYIKSKKVSRFIYIFRTLGKKNKIFNIFLYGFMILFDFYFYHTKVKKIIKKENYDYTISFYQFLPAYLTSIKKTKHIVWLHGSVEHFFGGIKNIFKNNYGKKLDRYDYIVTIADEMKEQIEDYYPDIEKNKIKRIYNPFDFDNMKEKSNNTSELGAEEKGLLSDDFICTVTRIDEHQKDLTTLILAYEKLFQENKINDKLYIIGDGPSKDELEAKVKEKKLDKNILFLGNKTNPFIWIKNSKIFILSSKFEGLPTVLIESMAMNTFIISSNCKTGPKEILKDGGCGDLFEIGNVDELSQKINFTLNNDNYRNDKINKASKRILEFSNESILNELDILLNIKRGETQ
jgi:glycosyltransferase involved in cell wall biosynthesis